VSAPIQTIGGRRFSFGKMSATNAVRVHVALLRVLGEPLTKLLAIGAKGKKQAQFLSDAHGAAGTEPPALPDAPVAGEAVAGDVPAAADGATAPDATVNVMGIEFDEADIGIVSGAVGLLAQKMDPDEFIATLALVLGSVNCEGRKIADMDVTFGDGKVDEMYIVFGHAMKVNFSGFFHGRLSAFVQLLRKQHLH